LIRHAEAEGNIYRRAHGQHNGLIIGRGYRQIELLRKRFEHEKIDAVYSSDLFRARATAEAISEQHGLPLNTTERLREINVGVWEDSAWGNLEYHEPEMAKNFGRDPALWRVEGGETYSGILSRLTECVKEIAQRHEGGTVAVFSHGLVIRVFLSGVMGIPSHEITTIPYCDNTAVTLLRYENGELSIDYQGDNSHLDNETSTFANQTWWRNEKEVVTENLRFMPFDERRDTALREMYRSGTGGGFSADAEYTVFLIEEPVGLVGLNMARSAANAESGDEDDAGWISYIYLKPEFRRKGYGVQLIGQAISVFRKLGREKLRVKVTIDNPAVFLFQKYEFEPVQQSGDCCLMEKNIRNW